MSCQKCGGEHSTMACDDEGEQRTSKAQSSFAAPAGSADDVIDQFIDRLFGRLTALGHDVTDCDGDDDPAIIIADWMHGRLTDFGDLLREAADSVHASLAETDISDERRAYRMGLENRLRERLQPNDQAHPTAAKASVGGTENI